MPPQCRALIDVLKGYCFFLTNLPPRICPRQAGAPRTEAPLHPRRPALQLAVS
jgi:hypothetical protein